MKLILVSLIILLISQSVKFFVFLYRGGKISSNSLFWNYLWAGKFPSTHMAIMGGAIYTIWYENGPDLLFGLGIILTGIVFYILIENKKRYKLLEAYYSKSEDKSIRGIVNDGKLQEFEGHAAVEIISGFLLGLLVAFVYNIYV